jgi:hypothetical protein
MIRSRIGHIVRVTIPVVLLVVVTSVITLSAQGNPTLNEILGKLDNIIGLLTPTPPGPVTLSTSALFIPPTQLTWCSVANVGTEPVLVTIRLFSLSEVPIAGTPIDATVNPGAATAFSFPGGGEGFRRCEFTFVGTSVRAALFAMNNVDSVTTASDAAR